MVAAAVARQAVNAAFTNRSKDVIVAANKVDAHGNVESVTSQAYVLNGKAYFGAYTDTGMTYPESATKFEEQYSKDAIRELSALNSVIYNDIRDVFVNIHSSCKDFNDKHMSDMVLIANQQIEYCTASINTLVKEGSSACLKAQIAIPGDSNLANHSKEIKQAKH
ncbi:hypothetical protein LTR70_007600 [Exophiala xenobiotica]|uniref:Uncharacterized protein n=1 Tax=Lithohypha guttulata TaxID=1690604 RepID=A0ABR0KII3_9EURO|nr:hypothetical protein LTR24_002269 [Lithohypha guttulata]KAK5313491.1 hypothetical protein LTR70_007600 [Exophiala xenobiotica]